MQKQVCIRHKTISLGLLVLVCLAFASLGAFAQNTTHSTAPSWRFSTPCDQLTGISTPTYVLEGRYVLGGPGEASHPLIVVHCANGKFLQAYLATGVAVAQNENRSIARSLKGIEQGEVD